MRMMRDDMIRSGLYGCTCVFNSVCRSLLVCGMVHVCFQGYHFVPEKIYFNSVFLQIRQIKPPFLILSVS